MARLASYLFVAASVPGCTTAFTPNNVPSSGQTSVVSRPTTALGVSSVATSFDLNSYLLSKKGPIEAALEASVKSRIPQTDKICEAMGYSLMAGGSASAPCSASRRARCSAGRRRPRCRRPWRSR
ncbi:hypothetical protein THAOC_16596 [Thalassiosira oceanica]|uniref:Uncharacterized protein n=1 Tax=Thalassiosira oceanica TaxID=159749 RepID=K0S9I1_THAOC|nr:hypothetical protein THAOC_16596 [Thalassiosira oceanica]|eukprot:EJK62778.1 hypothetical protein THAOC_16596 [Thalassiosira oceanica]